MNQDEDPDTFLRGVNMAEREDGFYGQADNSGWALGDHLRTSGTLHQDTWERPASALSLRNSIAIVPVADGGNNVKVKSKKIKQKWQYHTR